MPTPTNMNISHGYDLFGTIFQNQLLFGMDWILSIFLTLMILLLLTRDKEQWKTLAFPVMILLHIMGITPNILIYVTTGIIYGIEIISVARIGQLISAVRIPRIMTEKAKQKEFQQGIDKKFQKQLQRTAAKRKIEKLKTRKPKTSFISKELRDEIIAGGKIK